MKLSVDIDGGYGAFFHAQSQQSIDCSVSGSAWQENNRRYAEVTTTGEVGSPTAICLHGVQRRVSATALPSTILAWVAEWDPDIGTYTALDAEPL